MNLFHCLLCSAYTHVIAMFPNSYYKLMKLANGSKLRITLFENAAHKQLQTSSLSSKLSACDHIVSECLYICNQNFDQGVHFHCVAISDEDWMLWNVHDKEHDDTNISNQVPKFHDVHHVWVMTLSEQRFLKCDWLLYERKCALYMNILFALINGFMFTNSYCFIYKVRISMHSCSQGDK
jgi:hypothetical protein